jgi:hypothetical protein
VFASVAQRMRSRLGHRTLLTWISNLGLAANMYRLGSLAIRATGASFVIPAHVNAAVTELAVPRRA